MVSARSLGVSDATPAAHQLGHRERLRDRAKSGGLVALPDYELLELYLFRTFARGDVKPMAKALLARFGSFGQVIGATLEELKTVPGVGESAALDIKLLHEAALRAGRDRIGKRPVISSWSALLAYVRTALAHEPREQFRVLFLDKKNQLIADEVMNHGTVDHAPVYPREVMRRALELSSSNIILLHNHPSGDPTPSRPDIDMTKQIIEAGRALKIAVHDHLVVGREGVASFKALGLI
jgi:DNA repair protein RadC